MVEPKKILIVDDDFEIALFLKTTIEVVWPDYQVVNVPSGEEGVLELFRFAADLIITDIKLPGISGIEFIERVRGRQANLPVISITGDRSRQLQEKLQGMDLAGSFIKPIQVDDITAVIRRIFNVEAPPPPAKASSSPALLPQVGRRLSGLRVDTGAEYAMFVDLDGRPLITDGRVSGLDTDKVAAILAKDLASTSELAQLLNAPQPLTISYQAGAEHDLYTAVVGAKYLLALVFGSQYGRGKIGAVWVYARRAAQEILELLAAAEPGLEMAPVELVQAEPEPQTAKAVLEENPQFVAEPEPEPIDFPDLVPAEELDLDFSSTDVDSFWDSSLEEDEGSVREGMNWEEAQAQGLIPGGLDVGE